MFLQGRIEQIFNKIVCFGIYNPALSVEVVVGQDRDRYRAGIPGPELRVFRLLSASSTLGGVVKGFGPMLQVTRFAQKGNSLQGITDQGIFHPKV